VKSFLGPSPVGLATIFYCLRLETFLSSPPTTRRATVEVFDPAPQRILLLGCSRFLPYNPRYGPCSKQPFQQYFYCCMRIRCRGNVFTCCCLATALVCLLILRSLHSNGSTRYNMKAPKEFTRMRPPCCLCPIIEILSRLRGFPRNLSDLCAIVAVFGFL
jgi:hypothetical protein